MVGDVAEVLRLAHKHSQVVKLCFAQQDMWQRYSSVVQLVSACPMGPLTLHALPGSACTCDLLSS